jgi:arsenate reductase (glutaredoxin)
MKIYHNTRCKKSRAGLAYLEEKGLKFEVIDYIKNPLTETEINDLIAKTGLEAEQLVRKQEDYFKKELKGKILSHKDLVKAIAAEPKLLQRPIVVNGQKAVLANPPENINNII